MKSKHLFLAGTAALLALGGLWFARTASRKDAFHKSSMGVSFNTPHAETAEAKPGQMLNSPARLLPPNPMRRFTDFTPEQRVEFARKGHGPGG